MELDQGTFCSGRYVGHLTGPRIGPILIVEQNGREGGHIMVWEVFVNMRDGSWRKMSAHMNRGRVDAWARNACQRDGVRSVRVVGAWINQEFWA